MPCFLEFFLHKTAPKKHGTGVLVPVLTYTVLEFQELFAQLISTAQALIIYFFAIIFTQAVSDSQDAEWQPEAADGTLTFPNCFWYFCRRQTLPPLQKDTKSGSFRCPAPAPREVWCGPPKPWQVERYFRSLPEAMLNLAQWVGSARVVVC